MDDPLAIICYFVVLGLLAFVLSAFIKQPSIAKVISVIAGLFVGGGILVLAYGLQQMHTGFGGKGTDLLSVVLGIVGGLILAVTIFLATRNKNDVSDE